jgi:hypothetical protein
VRLRLLIDRRDVVVERVNLEASRRPDARALAAVAKARREAAEAADVEEAGDAR